MTIHNGSRKRFPVFIALVMAVIGVHSLHGQATSSTPIKTLLTQNHLFPPPARIKCDLSGDAQTYLRCVYDNAYPQIIDPRSQDALWQLSVIQIGELMLQASNPDLKTDANPYYLVVQIAVTGPAPRQAAFRPQACGAADTLVNQLVSVWSNTPNASIPLLNQNAFTQSFRFYSSSPCCSGTSCSVQHLMGWDRQLDVIHQSQIVVAADDSGAKTAGGANTSPQVRPSTFNASIQVPSQATFSKALPVPVATSQESIP
jgi:hypothetical protein